MTDWIEIDGSRGEGGGQILRTSLALAAITGRRLRIVNVRARRARPGLMQQHLTCVEAIAAVANAGLAGAKVGSTTVEVVPQGLRGGDWRFRIGTAGSVGLVLQTILVPMLRAPARSRVIIEGGTHNSAAPPFDFLARTFVPILRRMGARISLAIEAYGFYPQGGGRIVCEVEPGPLGGIALDEAGPVRRRAARALYARIPRAIAEREVAVVRKELGWADVAVEEVASPGPGNAVVLEVEREGVTEVVTAFGEKRAPAERVAGDAVREMQRYLGAGVPVGEHLADQLMLPMAVAGAGRYRTLPLTLHATTNLETIARFLDVPVDVATAPGGVTVRLGE